MVKVDDLLRVIFKGCYMGGFRIEGVWVGFWTTTIGGSFCDVWPFSPLILGIPKISLATLNASSKVALNEAPTDSSGALGRDEIWFTSKRDLGIPESEKTGVFFGGETVSAAEAKVSRGLDTASIFFGCDDPPSSKTSNFPESELSDSEIADPSATVMGLVFKIWLLRVNLLCLTGTGCGLGFLIAAFLGLGLVGCLVGLLAFSKEA